MTDLHEIVQKMIADLNAEISDLDGELEKKQDEALKYYLIRQAYIHAGQKDVSFYNVPIESLIGDIKEISDQKNEKLDLLNKLIALENSIKPEDYVNLENEWLKRIQSFQI